MTWPAGNPEAILQVLRAETLAREIQILGRRLDGSTLHLRFKTPTSVPWVQVHVQSTVAGEGGMSYDPANYTSSTEVDCRESRVQDVAVAVTASERYVIFLVPVQYDGAGNKVLYDGEGDTPDNMSFIDIGV